MGRITQLSELPLSNPESMDVRDTPIHESDYLYPVEDFWIFLRLHMCYLRKRHVCLI